MALTKDDIFEYCKNHSSTNCSDGKKYIKLSRLKEELDDYDRNIIEHLMHYFPNNKPLIINCIKRIRNEHFGEVLKDEN